MDDDDPWVVADLIDNSVPWAGMFHFDQGQGLFTALFPFMGSLYNYNWM